MDNTNVEDSAVQATKFVGKGLYFEIFTLIFAAYALLFPPYSTYDPPPVFLYPGLWLILIHSICSIVYRVHKYRAAKHARLVSK